MSDHNVVLTIAAYDSPAAAERDFDALGRGGTAASAAAPPLPF